MRILLILFAFVWSFGVGAPSFAADAVDRGTVTYTPDVTFTLRTNIADGKLVFVGDAGAISGKINPDLQVPENSVVQINIINGDGAIHDIAVHEFGAKSDTNTGKGDAQSIVFRSTNNDTFEIGSRPGRERG